jgi:8-amino-7-oxononanoate synthase
MGRELADRWNAQLAQLRIAGRYRELQPPTGIDFASNDYLGYGRECWPETPLRPPFARGGTGGSSRLDDLPHGGLASRLLRGHHAIWERVEDELAKFHGAEACLFVNSGFCANEGLLSTVIAPGDWVASDEFNHASIIDGLRLSRAERFVFRHNDLNHLESGLRVCRDREGGQQRFIVTESLFSMEGDRAPLAELVQLAERYEAHVIVDEAHATGCLGPQGCGCVDAHGLRPRVLATVHTGGKALGVVGAYVAGSRLLRDMLINFCRPFIFTTALPPVVGGWWLHALERVRMDPQRRETLHSRCRFFRNALREFGIEAAGSDHIVPVMLGDDAKAVEVSRRLQAHGWDIRAIRPPTVPPGTARLRISIHADHPEALLAEVARTLGGVLKKRGQDF